MEYAEFIGKLESMIVEVEDNIRRMAELSVLVSKDFFDMINDSASRLNYDSLGSGMLRFSPLNELPDIELAEVTVPPHILRATLDWSGDYRDPPAQVILGLKYLAYQSALNEHMAVIREHALDRRELLCRLAKATPVESRADVRYIRASSVLYVTHALDGGVRFDCDFSSFLYRHRGLMDVSEIAEKIDENVLYARCPVEKVSLRVQLPFILSRIQEQYDDQRLASVVEDVRTGFRDQFSGDSSTGKSDD